MNQQLEEISRVMRQTHGRDISPYDESFLVKSVDKRLAATEIKTAAAYSEVLSENSAEADAFFRSLHITYSEFFRNPLTFALLEQLVLPSLIAEKEKAGRAEIRIWSTACAAGQEAYSIAILLDELAVAFRIFATDISETDLLLAKKGVFDCGAVQNVRLKHIRKYFAEKGETYTIISALGDRIDFSAYDLLDESSVCPPASIYGDLDLVVCSNLLFYYRPDIRHFILNKLYHSLAPNGYLVTGEAEREIVAKIAGFRAVAPPGAVFKKTERRR